MATISAGNRKSTSCSNCRYRKVRCDRRDRLAAAGAPDDSVEVKCSQCASANIPCAFPTKAPKTGKRIREILERGSEGIELISSDTSTQPSIASSSKNRLDSNSQISDPSFSPLPVFSPSSASELLTSTRPGLFQVPGLTRKVLEGALSAYWRFVAPCYPSIPLRDFWARLGASFSLWSGDPIPENIEPLADLLILALAGAGAGQLEIDPSNTSLMERKFDLQADLLKAFFSKVSSDELKVAGLDGVEACYMVSTMELELKEQICWPDERETGEGDPSLDISPYSCEGAMRLGFKAGIHKRETREDLNEDEIELYRRKRFLFACLISLDACRALIFRRPQFLTEGSFEHDVDSLSELAPESERYIGDAEFYRNWVYSVNELSFLIRSIHSSLVTQKVKDQGILPSDLLQALEQLEEFQRELPDIIRWEKHLESHPFSEKRETDGALRTKLMILFLQGIWFSTIIAVWYAVEDVGFKSVAPSSASPSVKFFKSAPRSIPFTTSALRSSEAFEVSDPRHLAKVALSHLDSLMSSSVERWSGITKQVAGRGLLRSSAPLFRGTSAAGMLWCCERVKALISNPDSEGTVNVDVEQVKSLIGQAVDFLEAVRTCDSSRNTPALCERLNEALQGCKTGLSNVKIENQVVRQIDIPTTSAEVQASTSTSASVPSTTSPQKHQSRSIQRPRQASNAKRQNTSASSPSDQQQAAQHHHHQQPARLSPPASTPSWAPGPSSNPTPLGVSTPASDIGMPSFSSHESFYDKRPTQFLNGSSDARYSNPEVPQLPPLQMREPIAHWAQSLPYASSPVEPQYFPQYAPLGSQQFLPHPHHDSRPHPIPHQSSHPQLHHSYSNPQIQIKQEYSQSIPNSSMNYPRELQMHSQFSQSQPNGNGMGNGIHLPSLLNSMNQGQQNGDQIMNAASSSTQYRSRVESQEYNQGRKNSQDHSANSPSALSNYSNNSGGNSQIHIQAGQQSLSQGTANSIPQMHSGNPHQQQTPDAWLDNMNFNFNFQ